MNRRQARASTLFEIVDNHLIFKGLVNASSNLVDPPDIDNRESELKFSVYEHDKHPDRNGHKQIADAIYASFIVSAR